MSKGDAMKMPDSFGGFWDACQRNWKALSIQERNFRKSINMHPDKEIVKKAYECLEAAIRNDPIL